MTYNDPYRTAPAPEEIKPYRPALESNPEVLDKRFGSGQKRRYDVLLAYARKHAQFTTWDIANLMDITTPHAAALCSQAVISGYLELLKAGKPGRYGAEPATYRHSMRMREDENSPITKDEFIALIKKHATRNQTRNEDFRALVLGALKRLINP